MNKKYISIFLAGLLFAVCCYLCFFIKNFHFKDNKDDIIRDTLIVRDTLTIKEPVEKIRWKKKDTSIYIPIIDTLIIQKNDTTYIAMQEEKVQYEEEEYKVIISGINPKLEEISIYPKTIYITEKETTIKHWNFGITTGPTLMYDFNDKTMRSGIGIVFGFGYNF